MPINKIVILNVHPFFFFFFSSKAKRFENTSQQNLGLLGSQKEQHILPLLTLVNPLIQDM